MATHLSHDDLHDEPDPPPDQADPNTEGQSDDQQSEQFDLAEHLDSTYESMADDGSGDLPAESTDKGEGKEGDQGDQSQQQAAEGEGDQAAQTGEGEGTGDQAAQGEQAGEGTQDEDLELSQEEREQLSERATQRFDKLVERVKNESQEKQQTQERLQNIEERYNAVAETLQNTNATPDQLGEILDMTGELLSGDTTRGQQAVQRAYSMVKEYAKFYGMKLPETSLLDDHPDLQQQVEQGQMTQEIAEQHASLRNQQRATQTVRQNEQHTQQQMQQLQTEANQAAQQLTQLQSQWQQQDPDFQTKAPMLHEYANELSQQVLNGQLRPSEAVQRVQERYDTITKAMKTAAQTQRTAQGNNDPNPMRPQPRRGGRQNKNYGSVEEAVFGTYEEL